mmetsp:Transcript_9250/g.17636  ORF Transcript_9250/g.17636 Transcript_9250/m.17636 type:complete len:204 (+) Transcript_9250:1382-1993(+)
MNGDLSNLFVQLIYLAVACLHLSSSFVGCSHVFGVMHGVKFQLLGTDSKLFLMMMMMMLWLTMTRTLAAGVLCAVLHIHSTRTRPSRAPQCLVARRQWLLGVDLVRHPVASSTRLIVLGTATTSWKYSFGAMPMNDRPKRLCCCCCSMMIVVFVAVAIILSILYNDRFVLIWLLLATIAWLEPVPCLYLSWLYWYWYWHWYWQ